MGKPLKRHKYLRPFSRDHHQQLIFCFNLEKGLRQNIDFFRLKKYCTWFEKQSLSPHYSEEQKMLTSTFPKNDAEILKAIERHQKVKHLFENIESKTDLEELVDVFRKSIRSEERQLFEYLQNNYADLLNTEPEHEEITCAIPWEDTFWK